MTRMIDPAADMQDGEAQPSTDLVRMTDAEKEFVLSVLERSWGADETIDYVQLAAGIITAFERLVSARLSGVRALLRDVPTASTEEADRG